MSLMGQQADKDENKSSGVETLIGSLLDNVDVTELLTGALTSSSSKKATKKTTKKTSTKKKAASSDSSSGGILGSLFKLLK